MRTIRKHTFETNSSSTHSITMCMEDEFNKWKNGELYWDRWGEKFISKSEFEEKVSELRKEFIDINPEFDENDEVWQEKFNRYINEDKTYYTYEEFDDYDYMEYETYITKFKTSNNEVVVAFGYYGNDY